MGELRRLVSHNRAYKPKLDSLGILIDRRRADLSEFIVKFQRGGFVITDEMITSRASNKIDMDNIRLLVKELENDEKELVNKRNSKLDGFFRSTGIIAIISVLIALVTIFYSLITYNRENKAKEAAGANAEAYRKELEARVNELNKVNVELTELRSIEKFATSGRIARTIAHKVRNPLTNIALAAEQLKETGNETDDKELMLGIISRSVSRINQLVADLLNSTRIEQLEYGQANINQLLNEALELAQDRIELNHIKVEKHYDKNISDSLVDKEKIKLAFLNIIVNAIEAMKNNSGILEIKTIKEKDKCIIEFKDNGAGIDTDTLQKIFEPYFTGKMKGNGLRLTHTQNIIINHKGSISVSSKVGQGSTFSVNLNLNSEKPG